MPNHIREYAGDVGVCGPDYLVLCAQELGHLRLPRAFVEIGVIKSYGKSIKMVGREVPDNGSDQ